jgi:hypothetical protein
MRQRLARRRQAWQRCMWRWKGCWEPEGHPHDEPQHYKECMFHARQPHAIAIHCVVQIMWPCLHAAPITQTFQAS